ncbi:MAG: hypothetical protein V9G24_05525 [Rhodoblastus sp.]
MVVDRPIMRPAMLKTGWVADTQTCVLLFVRLALVSTAPLPPEAAASAPGACAFSAEEVSEPVALRASASAAEFDGVLQADAGADIAAVVDAAENEQHRRRRGEGESDRHAAPAVPQEIAPSPHVALCLLGRGVGPPRINSSKLLKPRINKELHNGCSIDVLTAGNLLAAAPRQPAPVGSRKLRQIR